MTATNEAWRKIAKDEGWRKIEINIHRIVVEPVGSYRGDHPPLRARCLYCGWVGRVREKEAWAKRDGDEHIESVVAGWEAEDA